MIQGSPEWLAARVGKVTASRVHDIVATTKSGGFTAGRKNYMGELVCERLTGRPYPQYVNAAMEHGTEKEPAARFRYALAKGVEVTEVGFIPHPTIVAAGASPDGLIGADGLCEFKCPFISTVHIERLLSNNDKIEPTIYDQIQFQLACTNRAWCDFVSYDDRFDDETMQLLIWNVARDDKRIAQIELQVTQFLSDVDATVDLLHKRYPRETA